MKITEMKVYQIITSEKTRFLSKMIAITFLGVVTMIGFLKIMEHRGAQTEMRKSTYVIYAHEDNNSYGGVRSFIIPFAINDTSDIERAVQIIEFVDRAKKVQLVSWQSVIDVRKTRAKK